MQNLWLGNERWSQDKAPTRQVSHANRDHVAVSQVATTKMQPMVGTQGVWASHFPLVLFATCQVARLTSNYIHFKLALRLLPFKLPCSPSGRSPSLWSAVSHHGTQKKPRKEVINKYVSEVFTCGNGPPPGPPRPRGKRVPKFLTLYCSLVSHTIPSALPHSLPTRCLLNYYFYFDYYEDGDAVI